MMLCAEWSNKMLTIDNRMPAVRTPLRIRCPVVNLLGFRFELAGFHEGNSISFLNDP